MGQKRYFFLVLFIFLLGVFFGNSDAQTPSSSTQAPHFSYRNNGDKELLGHVPREVRSASLVGHHRNPIDLLIIMPLTHQDDLNNLLAGLNDPKSPYYHQYLKAGEFKQRFGASAADIAQVKSFLASNGLNASEIKNNGDTLKVSAADVAHVEKTFGGFHIKDYKKQDGTSFYSADANPIIPIQVADKINAIVGLDNARVFTPAIVNAQITPLATPLNASPPSSGSSPQVNPSASFSNQNVFTAYNLSSIPTDGKGETLAVVEADAAYNASDMAQFENTFGLPNIGAGLQTVYQGGTPFSLSTSAGWAEETILDIEMLRAFASGANTILVYEAMSNSYYYLLSTVAQVASEDRANIISFSWDMSEWGGETYYDSSLMQMAAQGQSVFVASGDSGAYNNCPNGNNSCANEVLGPEWPASSPYVTSVGASNLTTNANGSWANESAGSWSGGGVSAFETIPVWQQTTANQALAASKVSTTYRNIPDIAFSMGYSSTCKIVYNGSLMNIGGTSCAAPSFAGLMARVNEGRTLAGQSTIGLFAPALYQVAQGTNASSDFHDITAGNNGYYQSETGYDLATGLGSFNGQNLYNDLVANDPVLYGDVNGDFQVTIFDAAEVAEYAVGLISLSPSQLQEAKVSSSTEASPTVYDAFLIAQYVVGIITKFPAQP